MTITAKFTAIDLIDTDVVEFVVQDKTGVSAKFRMVGFQAFVFRAIELIAPPPTLVVTDTDQLLNRWFDFDPVTF